MRKLSGYSLTWKLLLVPVVATLGFVVYLIYSSLVLSDGNSLLKEIRDSDFPILEVAGKNLERYEDVAVALNTAAATGEVELLGVAKNKASEILDSYETLGKLDTAHKNQIEKLKSGFNAYFALAIDVAQRMTTKTGMPSAEQLMKMRDARDAYLSGSVAYRDIAEKEFHETVGEAIGRSERARAWGTVIGIFMLFVIAVLTWLVTRGIVALERGVAERNEMLAAANSELVHSNQQLEQTHLVMLQQLGRAADYRDNETGMHIVRVGNFSKLLGLASGFLEQRAEMLMYASMMHDVGKIGVPDHILLKPGKLTEEEFEVIKKHPEIGAKILGEHDAEVLKMAKQIALGHHEKWNGQGYPYGLSGTDIPITARIVAIVDVFDALTSERPYKAAWPVEKAMELIIKEAGQHFDPELAKQFLSMETEIRRIVTEYSDAANE